MSLKILCLAVGSVICAAGVAMFLPAFAGLLWDDGTGLIFLAVGLPCAAGGWALRRWGLQTETPAAPTAYALVGLGAVSAIVISALPYLLWGLGPVDALFESTSGWTTTGATVFPEVEKLPHGILLWRAATQWLGGLGILMVTIVMLPPLEPGRVLMLGAVDFSGGRKFRPRFHDLGRDLLILYGLFTGLNVILLFLGGLDVRDSLCLAFSTISTGGFSTRNGSLPQNSGLYVEIVTVFFMLVGAANFLLHVRIFRGEAWAHFRSELFRLLLTVILVLLGLVMIDAAISGRPEGFWNSLRHSIFAAVSFVTTTGFRAADPDVWSDHAHTLFLLAVFVGGMAGSTAGGLKIQRLAILIRVGWQEAHRLLHPNRVVTPRVEGEAIESAFVHRSLMIVVSWILLFLMGAGFLMFHGQGMDTAVSTSAAAINNVGASTGGTADHWDGLSAPAKIVMLLLMLGGRLELFALLSAFAPYVWRRRVA